MAEFTAQIYGARGTLPVVEPEMARFGGNTSCVALRLDGRVLIFDAGSGIVPLGRALVKEGVREIDLVISHAHYDHVLGLPFFAPLMHPDVTVRLWFAGTEGAPDGAHLLADLIRPPFLPFVTADLAATIECKLLPRSGATQIAGAQITTAPVNHPGGNTGLRVDHAGASLVYVADFEHDDGAMDAALCRFMAGADLAFLDCTYTPEDYAKFKGFGHSHWQKCSALAGVARVKRWGLFHHAHTRSDAELDGLAKQVCTADPNAFVTRKGAIFDLL
ncbi:MAG: phosphoribosyl 1,2-cyclic phosphodiesterase [Dinoroseobacter sp.]